MTTARGLFWKFGVKKVTVEEICTEAGISKMTFYRQFKDKFEVAKKVLDQFTQDGLDKYRAIMEQDISFHEKLKLTTLLKQEASEDISREFINDIMLDQNSDLKNHMMTIQQNFELEIKSHFEAAQKNGEIRSDLNLEFVMLFNRKVAEFINDEHFRQLFPDPQELIMQIMNITLFGMETRPEDQ